MLSDQEIDERMAAAASLEQIYGVYLAKKAALGPRLNGIKQRLIKHLQGVLLEEIDGHLGL